MLNLVNFLANETDFCVGMEGMEQGIPVIVFLIVTIVQLAINLASSVGGDENNAGSAWDCARQLITGEPS